jgi:hypothetical protein
MLIAQVSINLHGQGSTGFVPQPPADRGDINARLDTPAGKMMAQVEILPLKLRRFRANEQ